jgi:L-ribulose-5-phosphate 4-epimerase
MNKYQHIQEAAYKANMQLPQLGLVLFTFGNVRVQQTGNWVCLRSKPSGVPYEDLSPNKMVIVDFEGKTVEGCIAALHLIQLTHAVLYKHWENITGIVHTHSTYATAWAQSQRDIPFLDTTHADHNTS